MDKVYDCNSVTIYQGEAFSSLRELPEGMVDAVITDPPYCSGAATLAGKQTDPAKKYQSSETQKSYPPLLGDAKDQRSFTTWATLWLGECWRVSKAGSPLLLFSDWRQLPAMTDAVQAAGWQWLGIVPWNKRTARPSIGRFKAQCEYVLFASKGRLVPATRACLPGLYEHTVIASKKVHINSKPLPLLQSLMEIVQPGGVVLDPFIGGGTTALAALATGRGCVGIELSPEYAAITVERLKQHRM